MACKRVGWSWRAFSRAAAPVAAQRVPFERAFDVSGVAILDVSTDRGRITVSAGEPGRVQVSGEVTVAVGWDVPSNAPRRSCARWRSSLRSKAAPTRFACAAIGCHDATRRHGELRRARASRYPGDHRQRVGSHERERTSRGSVRCARSPRQSNSSRLGGAATVTTGSGSVKVDGVGGLLSVTTSSSGITARDLHAGLRIRTKSGGVEATFIGERRRRRCPDVIERHHPSGRHRGAQRDHRQRPRVGQRGARRAMARHHGLGQHRGDVPSGRGPRTGGRQQIRLLESRRRDCQWIRIEGANRGHHRERRAGRAPREPQRFRQGQRGRRTSSRRRAQGMATTRSRPPCFARYSASSARRMKVSADSPLVRRCVTPIDNVQAACPAAADSCLQANASPRPRRVARRQPAKRRAAGR